MPVDQLHEHELWWNGPDFLKEDDSNFPEQPELGLTDQEIRKEKPMIALTIAKIQKERPGNEKFLEAKKIGRLDLNHYNSLRMATT
jgi:hypothetical protein